MAEQRHRFAIAIGLAGVAGALCGLGTTVPRLAAVSERPAAEIGLLASTVVLGSFAVAIGLFLAGYRWARRATVPGAYGRFAVSLFAAALVGQGVGFLPLFLLSGRSVLTGVGVFGGLAVSLLFVPVPGLAGGAIAQYRTDAS